MFKNLLYLILFSISSNLLSMQLPPEFSAGRPIAQPGSKEAKLLKVANADYLDNPLDSFQRWRLIKNGTNVNACYSDGTTPLHKACATLGLPLIVENFLKAGANPNLEDIKGKTPLHECAYANRPRKTKLLIKYGANIDQKDIYQRTPIIEASKYGNKKIVKMLIAAGAKLDEKDFLGKTAIQYARNNRHTEIVQMLKNAGAQG